MSRILLTTLLFTTFFATAQERITDIIFKDNFETPNNSNNMWNVSSKVNTWKRVSKGTFPFDSPDFKVIIPLTTKGTSWMMINAYESGDGYGKKYDNRLITPRFDLSKSNEVFLKFDNLFRKGDLDSIFVEVSTDSLNWSRISLYDDLNPFEFQNRRQTPYKVRNPQQVILNLSEYAAQKKKVWVAFHYKKPKNSDGFAWQIDNVEVWQSNPTSKCDVGLFDDAYAIPQAVTPRGQQQVMPFALSLENRGLDTIQNVKLEVNIYNADDQTLLFHDEQYLGKLDIEEVVDNQIFKNKFLNNTKNKYFIGEYKITPSCKDELPDDNIYQFQFRHSDSTFQKETDFTNFATSPYFDSGEVPKWEWGNFYYVENAHNLAASSIQFGFQSLGYDAVNKNKGDEAIVKLYKFNPKTDKRVIGLDELALVAKNSYIFTEDDDTKILTIPLLHPTTKQLVALENKTEYFASVEYIPRSSANNEMRFYANDTMFYEANYQLTKSLGQTRRTSALRQGEEQIFSLDCFDYWMVPRIRLNVRSLVNAKDVVTDATIRLFPNPVSSQLQIDSPNQEFTHLKLQNLLGQTVFSQPFATTINVANLPNGIYYLTLENDKSMIVKKICIEK